SADEGGTLDPKGGSSKRRTVRARDAAFDGSCGPVLRGDPSDSGQQEDRRRGGARAEQGGESSRRDRRRGVDRFFHTLKPFQSPSGSDRLCGKVSSSTVPLDRLSDREGTVMALKRLLRGGTLAAAVFLAAPRALAQTYSITDLGTLGGSFSEVHGIN